MNTILQKRIEEKAEELAQKYFPNEMNIWARQNYEAQYVESACKEIATFALQNQWISVKEALPEEDIPNCFVAYKTFDKVFYSTGSYEKDNDEWYVDSVGFNVKVTHYMPIPSLEGGEK